MESIEHQVQRSPVDVGLTALVLQLGGTPAEADAALLHLHGQLPARAPSALVAQVQAALDAVRADDTFG